MILMYHNIGIESGFNTVSVSNFKEQLNFIKDNFQVISLENYVQKLQSGKSLAHDLSITFDDGYKSFSEVVVPLLENFSFTATLFIPVRYIGKNNAWDKDRTSINLALLNWEELSYLSQHPLIELGSHGLTHKSLGKLSSEEVEEEIMESKKILSDCFDMEIQYFSYPYGQIIDYNKYVIHILKRYNFKAACSTRYGLVNKKKDIYQLKRIEVEPQDTISDFQNKCKTVFHKKLFIQFTKELLYRLGLNR